MKRDEISTFVWVFTQNCRELHNIILESRFSLILFLRAAFVNLLALAFVGRVAAIFWIGGRYFWAQVSFWETLGHLAMVGLIVFLFYDYVDRSLVYAFLQAEIHPSDLVSIVGTPINISIAFELYPTILKNLVRVMDLIYLFYSIIVASAVFHGSVTLNQVELFCLFGIATSSACFVRMVDDVAIWK